MPVIIQSVTRALDIIEVLAAHPEGLGVKAIAGALQLNTSTTHHLVNTLEDKGFAARQANGTYRLGPAVPRLFNAYSQIVQNDRHLREILETLAQATRETTYSAGWQNGEVVILTIIEGAQALRVGGLHVGFGGHTHARASGKALLAHLSEDELAKFFANRPLTRLTPRTISSLRALKSDLRQIVRRGYAIDREEFTEGVCCVAAPVFGADGRATLALSVSAPAWRFSQNEPKLVQSVLGAAREASAALGYREPLETRATP